MSFAEQLYSQVVSFQILDGNEPIAGATIYVQDSEPPIGTVTDINGRSTLDIPKNLRTVELAFLGPKVKFDVPAEIDSVRFNLAKQKLQFYRNGELIKKQKLKTEDH
jgi:hypothetical protein